MASGQNLFDLMSTIGNSQAPDALAAAEAGTVAAEAPKQQAQQSVQEQFGLDFKDVKIVVVGAGGAGCNTVTRLTNMGVKGAKTLAVNTDAKHLGMTNAHQRILIGRELTKGLGTGGYPDIGKRAAQESEREIKAALKGADMVYTLCGMGGGTGTGSLPEVAKYAKEMGAIVIGTVTMPFKIEGARVRKAEDGLYELRKYTDTAIVIENDRLLKVAGDLPLDKAFSVADNLVSTMIKGITETISEPSLVNLDFADVKAIMNSGGVAAVGFAESGNKNRAEDAIVKALTNPLVDVDFTGGSGALLHITGGEDLKLEEVNYIGEYVSKQLDLDAQVIWGSRIDPAYNGKIRVISVITGVKSPYMLGPLEKQAAAARVQSQRFAGELGIPIFA